MLAICVLLTENNIKRLKSLSLYSKACAFVGDTWDEGHAPFRWLYRNKSYEYFRDIRERNGGIMTVTPKDNGGDQDCPINGGRLSGLFFMASVSYSGEPLPMSPFGPCRLLVPAEELLGPSYHLYFADFYCMPYSDYHYVTLVVTVPYSEADDFCTTHLPLLDIEDNPFLFINDYNAYPRVTTADHLFVEVFYTEDLDISKYKVIPNIPTFGKGHSTPGGIPKNEYCQVCNL